MGWRMRKAYETVKPFRIPALTGGKLSVKPSGDQGVRVGMEVVVLAEGVNRHDDTGQVLGQGKGGAQVFEQALVAADAGGVLEAA